jgi:hypothetical protein
LQENDCQKTQIKNSTTKKPEADLDFCFHTKSPLLLFALQFFKNPFWVDIQPAHNRLLDEDEARWKALCSLPAQFDLPA